MSLLINAGVEYPAIASNGEGIHMVGLCGAKLICGVAYAGGGGGGVYVYCAIVEAQRLWVSQIHASIVFNPDAKVMVPVDDAELPPP